VEGAVEDAVLVEIDLAAIGGLEKPQPSSSKMRTTRVRRTHVLLDL
jgi:hypothetical protein